MSEIGRVRMSTHLERKAVFLRRYYLLVTYTKQSGGLTILRFPKRLTHTQETLDN